MSKRITVEQKSEVIKLKLEIPTLSAREISEQLGISERSVARIISEDLAGLGKESTKIASLLDVNLSILAKGKDIIEKEIEKLGRGEGIVKINSVSDIRTLSATLEDAFKQNQLIQDKPTENVNVIGDVLKEIQSKDS